MKVEYSSGNGCQLMHFVKAREMEVFLGVAGMDQRQKNSRRMALVVVSGSNYYGRMDDKD